MSTKNKFSLRKVLCLGINCKVGDLMRLAGACINDGVCGLIRQYTCNLTSRSIIFIIKFRRYCMAVVSSCFKVWSLVFKRAKFYLICCYALISKIEVKSTWSKSTGLLTRYKWLKQRLVIQQ